MNDAELYERACRYLNSVLEEDGEFESKTRYLYFLRETIDQYLNSLGGEVEETILESGRRRI